MCNDLPDTLGPLLIIIRVSVEIKQKVRAFTYNGTHTLNTNVVVKTAPSGVMLGHATHQHSCPGSK